MDETYESVCEIKRHCSPSDEKQQRDLECTRVPCGPVPPSKLSSRARVRNEVTTNVHRNEKLPFEKVCPGSSTSENQRVSGETSPVKSNSLWRDTRRELVPAITSSTKSTASLRDRGARSASIAVGPVQRIKVLENQAREGEETLLA